MECSDVVLIRQGDPDIYKKIVEKWFPKLCILINSYIFNPEVSKELAEDVLISLWENRTQLRQDTSFDKYFYVLAKNKAMNHLRQRKYDIIGIEEYETELIKINLMEQLLEKDTLENLIMKENMVRFKTLIEAIPANSKEVFMLSRRYNLKNKEIATRLGISVKAVEYHITKALAFLKDNMKTVYGLLLFIKYL